jgi:hypothetical protein
MIGGSQRFWNREGLNRDEYRGGGVQLFKKELKPNGYVKITYDLFVRSKSPVSQAEIRKELLRVTGKVPNNLCIDTVLIALESRLLLAQDGDSYGIVDRF